MNPLASILTPSHSARFLGDLARSIKEQTFEDWEWVILVNGALPVHEAWGAILPYVNASKVRILRAAPGTPPKIGALKRQAFDQGRGSILVEADHDDILLPLCLEKLAAAVGEGAGFVYSNTAPFLDGSGARVLWPASVTTRPFQYNGHELSEGVVFPPSPHMIFCCESGCPIHVRAWTRGAYSRAGGHDPSYSVMDDMELIARTYASGVEFRHLDECLYLYRVHPQSCLQTSTGTDPRVPRAEYLAYLPRFAGPVLRRWCYDNSLYCAEGPWSAIQTFLTQPRYEGKVGGIFLPQNWPTGVKETLEGAYKALVHGGFLFGLAPIEDWDAKGMAPFIRPSEYKGGPRFQAVFIQELGNKLRFVLAAKKRDERLPGMDLWSPIVNERDAAMLNELNSGTGVRFSFENGRLRAVGPRPMLEVVVPTLEQMNPVYSGLIDKENKEGL